MNLSTPRSISWQSMLRSVVLVGASVASGAALAQKIDDIPPAAANNVPPNFMFMIDNSGSMSNIVPASPFNQAVTYLASCPVGSTVATTQRVDININGTGEPRFTAGGTTFRHTTDLSASTAPRRCFNPTGTYNAALLGEPTTPTSGYLPAQYSGNYLNWYFGTYTAQGNHPLTGWTNGRKRLATGSPGAVETRIEIARTSAKNAINTLQLPLTFGGPASFRVGLSTYRSGNGGALRVPVRDLTSAHKNALDTAIDALSPSGNTPIATTLSDIGRYFAAGYNGNVSTTDETGGAILTNVPINDFLRQDGRQSCLSLTTTTPTSCTSQADPGSTNPLQRPIQYWCQRSSIFALTDGRPTSDRQFDNNTYLRDYDGDCTTPNAGNCDAGGGSDRKDSTASPARTYENSTSSDYMDDVAKALFDVDLRPDLAKPAPLGAAVRAKNNLTTYMIGFADDAVRNDELLINTARQGGGRFIAASDGPALADAFRDVITDALDRNGAAAAVAVTNARIDSDTVGYASSYDASTWFGDLEAYSLNTSTGLQEGAAVWSARTLLNALAPSERNIASFSGTSGLAFTAANAGSFPGIVPTADMSTSGRGAGDVIDYVRGVRTYENDAGGFRQRVHLLGDIVNAEPVVVNYASGGATIFQAANDGMLHVFDGRVDSSVGTRGQELWAYVPRLIHDKLAGLADPDFSHQFLVDGTPASAAVTGFGAMTRILVGGLGKGGRGYYALDITSGTAADQAAAVSKVKWEFSQSSLNAATQGYLGYSFGTPLIVNTASGWKVVVASGYRNDGGTGGVSGGDGRGRVWVLNLDTGAIEKTFTTPSGFGSSTDSLGLAHLGKLANTTEDVVVRYVYGGDLKGNLWRFDLSAADGAAPVQIATLTGPNGDIQPVSSPPVIGPVAGSSSKLYVYVGTGQYFSVDDVPGTATPNALATQTQTMYGIADDTAVTTPVVVTRATGTGTCPTGGGTGDLVCQSLTRPNTTSNFTATINAVDLSSRKGFYVDVPITNGRVNTQAALTVRGTLVFVVNEPTNVLCNPGGNSYFFALSAGTGGAVPRILGGNTYFDAGFLLANALSSRAVLITTSGGTRGLFRLSNKTTESKEIGETATGTANYKRIYKRALN